MSTIQSSEKYNQGKRENENLAKSEKGAGQPRNHNTGSRGPDCGCNVSFKRMEKFTTAG